MSSEQRRILSHGAKGHLSTHTAPEEDGDTSSSDDEIGSDYVEEEMGDEENIHEFNVHTFHY